MERNIEKKTPMNVILKKIQKFGPLSFEETVLNSTCGMIVPGGEEMVSVVWMAPSPNTEPDKREVQQPQTPSPMPALPAVQASDPPPFYGERHNPQNEIRYCWKIQRNPERTADTEEILEAAAILLRLKRGES